MARSSTRRWFVTLLPLLLVVAPVIAETQDSGKVQRVGVLLDVTPRNEVTEKEWRQLLRSHGYVEGQNLALRFVWTEAHRVSEAATDLVRWNADVIVAFTTSAALAAKRATTTIPIVVNTADPVESGLIDSLSRPGANVTGVYLPMAELAAKRLQMLRDLVPSLETVAIVFNPNVTAVVRAVKTSAEKAARQLGVKPLAFEMHGPQDAEAVVAAAAAAGARAILVLNDPVTQRASRPLAQAAAKYRLPGSHSNRWFPEAGGLFSYSAENSDVFAMSAAYVDKILKGAKPADLPMEQPLTYQLTINLKAAKALGLSVPPSLLLQATRIIE